VGLYFGLQARNRACDLLPWSILRKTKAPEVFLQSPGLENIPQVPANRAKVGQNPDARIAVSATLSVLKWSGAIFWPRSSKPSVEIFFFCPFHLKPRPSRVSLGSLGVENIPQFPANRAKVDQNHDVRKVVSATVSVLKRSGAIFRPKSFKPSVQISFLSPFHWKPRPTRVSLESSQLQNIPQVPGNRAKVGQNHDARKAVSATLSVLKWSGAIFRPKSSKPSMRSFYLCPFLCKPRHARVSLESLGMENIPQVPGNRAKVGQNHDGRKGGLGYSFSLKMKWGYISG